MITADIFFYVDKKYFFQSALTVNEKSRRSEPVLSQGKIEFDDHNAVVKPRSEHQDIHDAELNGGDGVMDDYIRKNIHARFVTVVDIDNVINVVFSLLNSGFVSEKFYFIC